MIGLDPNRGRFYYFDSKMNVLKEDTLFKEQFVRFLSVDPLTRSFPFYTPYQFAGNKPIAAIDLDGLEEYYSTQGKRLGKYGKSTEVRIINNAEIASRAGELLKSPNSYDQGYFEFYLPSFSTSFSESKRTVQENVLQSIYSKELGFNLDDLNGQKITTEDRLGALAACYCIGDERYIIINPSLSFSNDKNFIINALQKENTHVYDEGLQKQGIAPRELNGFMRALKEPSFSKTPAEYQKKFLQGAGLFIWEYINQAEVNPKYSSAYQAKADEYIKFFQENGVEFDFSESRETLKILQEFYKKEEGVRHTPDSHEIKVRYNGEKL